jgi:hypothetical protein
MAEYDFRSLSDVDFEDLVRDLLQEHWGLPLEAFSAGRDDGIDLRYARVVGDAVVVQCKHYAGSPWSAIKAAAKKERSKVDRLRPSRYVFVTSQNLTPNRKDVLQGILGPCCHSPADIIGRRELNALLREHGHVERRHPRLWLTSSAILTRLLHGGVFERARILQDGLPSTLRRYVPHPSLGEARALLDRLHYCVVTGIPGVGKTTLAEVLLADLVGRGYELIVLNRSVSEALEVLDPSQHQVLYFDDFLGMTMLESMARNEDRDLLTLFGDVRRSQTTRLVLTTREYILRQAIAGHERLDRPGVEWARCTVELTGYDALHRARILYNHLRFSGLADAQVQAMLVDRGYRAIVEHANFNPRIIEWMTNPEVVERESPTMYPLRFLRALDRPDELWRHAYESHVSLASRHVLTALASLPSGVLIADLERAFWPLHRARSERHHLPTRPDDFRDALRELDGTFVSTSPARFGRGLFARFHNPSVRDYVEARLTKNAYESESILDSAPFFEQVYYASQKGFARGAALFSAAVRTFDATPAILDTVLVGEAYRHQLATRSSAARGAFIVRASQHLPPSQAINALRPIVEAACSSITSGLEDEDPILSLLRALDSSLVRLSIVTAEEERAVIRDFLNRVSTFYDFQAFSELVERSVWLGSSLGDMRQELAGAFERVVEEEAEAACSDYSDDPEMIEYVKGEAERHTRRMGASLQPGLLMKLAEAAAAAEVSARERENERPGKEQPASFSQRIEASVVDEIDALFQTLLHSQ